MESALPETTELTAETIGEFDVSEASVVDQVHRAFFERANMSPTLDAISSPVWVKDAHGRFVRVNQAWLDESGIESSREVVGLTEYDLATPKEAAESIRREGSVIASEERLEFVTTSMTESGSVTHHNVLLPLVDRMGMPIGVVGTRTSTPDVEQTNPDSTTASQAADSPADTTDTELETAEPAQAPVANDIDPLTGTGSRSALHNKVDELLAKDDPVSILLLDLDDFAVVNESLGHAFGDKMLAAAARRLGSAFSDLLFRPSGDEFAIVLPSDDIEQLNEIAETVLGKWRTPLIIDGSEIFSGISIGIVSRQPDHESANEMFRDAETALHKAKDLGRNRAVVFTPELRAAVDEELNLQMLGRRAVQKREFDLYWQPMFDARTGSIVSCEALLRWRPAGGSVAKPAGEFIPFLERSGLITPVGEQVIQEAFQQHRDWRNNRAIPGNPKISINVSRRQLISGGVVDMILEGLGEYSVPADQLTIEFPESALMDLAPENIADLERLRSAGIRLVLDDFGGGHSSFGALMDLPIEIVKLDRSAAARIVEGEDNPLLDAIQMVLRSKNQVAVVGGVENQMQLEWLRDRGWQWVQGYHLAKPMSADDLTTTLSSRANGSSTPNRPSRISDLGAD